MDKNFLCAVQITSSSRKLCQEYHLRLYECNLCISNTVAQNYFNCSVGYRTVCCFAQRLTFLGPSFVKNVDLYRKYFGLMMSDRAGKLAY